MIRRVWISKEELRRIIEAGEKAKVKTCEIDGKEYYIFEEGKLEPRND